MVISVIKITNGGKSSLTTTNSRMCISVQSVKVQNSTVSETVITSHLLIVDASDHKMPAGEGK